MDDLQFSEFSASRKHRADNQIHDLERLRDLLLQPENQRLAAIEAILQKLDGKIGDTQRLENSVAEILTGALQKAEVINHRQLARALAPVVVASIRNEISQSKEMMIEALYPITGRLVAAGIAVALADLVTKINQSVDNLVSMRTIHLRWQAWRSGRPIGELLLAASQQAQLRRLLVLQKGSGLLLGQWREQEENNERDDLIGGLLAALTDFARNALGKNEDLRTLDLGGSVIYLRNSAQLILAADFSGTPNSLQEKILDNGFSNLSETLLEHPEQASGLIADLAGFLNQQRTIPNKSRSWWRSPVFLGALGLLVAALWLGSSLYSTITFQNRLNQRLDEFTRYYPIFAAYPLRLNVDFSSRQVELKGLVPSSQSKSDVLEAMAVAAKPFQLVDHLAVIVDEATFGRSRQEQLQQDQKNQQQNDIFNNLSAQNSQHLAVQLSQTSEEFDKNIAVTRQTLEQQQQLVANDYHQKMALLDDKIAQLQLKIEHLSQPSTTSLTEELWRQLQSFDIYFDVYATTPADSGIKQRLADLAPLIQAAGGVRIIVLLDNDRASVIRNRELAIQRARTIAEMLNSVGVEPGLTKIILDEPIAKEPIETDQSRNNRRVILEPLQSFKEIR